MRRGGGVGYDFSRIRPRGAWVGGTAVAAHRARSSYMRVFDRSCETVESAGARRGAQMGVLRCDHPDIEEFIHAKDDGRPAQLQHLGRRHRRLHAGGARRRRGRAGAPRRARRRRRRPAAPTSAPTGCGSIARCRRAALWDQIMRSTYDHAEPGVLFLDRINRDNNLVVLRDDRGDQPLRRAAAAALRLLLPGLDRPDALRAPTRSTPTRASTSPASRAGRAVAVRMLDNVLDVTRLAAAAAARRGDGQAPHRPGLHRPGRRADRCWACATTPPRRATMARAHRARRCATPPTRVGRPGRASAAPSRCSTPTCYLRGGTLRLAPAGSAEGARSARTASATRTCCRSRRPAPSAWPSPTTPATASSRRSPGPTRARSAWPTARFKEYRGRGPRLAAVPAPAGRRRAAAAGLRHRAGDERAGARGDGRGGRAVHRHRDLARPSTCRPTIPTPTSRTCTCRPGSRA